MAEQTNVQLVARVFQLVKALNDWGDISHSLREVDDKKYKGFFVLNCGHRDEFCHYLDPDSGAVVEHSWEEGYHNGSSYNDEWKLLDLLKARKYLQGLVEKLENRGIEREQIEEEAESKRREKERLRGKFLKRVGIQ